MTDLGDVQIADFGSAILTRPTALEFTHTTSFNYTMRFTVGFIFFLNIHAH